MLVRNNILLGLLRKANISVPAFVGPKEVFDYVVTQQENIQPDHDEHDKKKGKLVVSKETTRKSKGDDLPKKENKPGKIKSDRLPKDGTAKASESIKIVAKDGKKISGVFSTAPATVTATTTALFTPLMTTTGILVSLGSHQPPVKRTNAGKRIIRIRSRLSNPIAGKVAIPALKNNVCYKTQWKRNRQSKKKIQLVVKKPNEVGSGDQKSNSKSTNITSMKRANDETIEGSDSIKRLKDSTRSVSSAGDRASVDSKRTTTINCSANSVLPQVSELPNDLLASLQVPQHDSHLQHESLSPTAAFLMSFPVVSAVTGGRMVDGENNADTSSPHLLQLDDLSAKHQHSDNNLLDNISSLFTTKDYDRFVEDVAKNGSGIRPSDDFFDFQLKPITNPRKLTVSVSTSLFTPDILPAAPIYHSVSGYSTAPLVPLQPTPVMSSTLFPTASCSISGPSFDFLNKNAGIRLNSDCLADNSGFTFSLTSTTTTLPTSASCALATARSEKSYGFYDSLSTIGASYAHTMTTTKSNQSSQLTSSTSYTSALSLSSSSTNPKPLSTNYTQHSPFTFSLSATTGTKSSLCSSTTLPKHITVTTSSSVYNSQHSSQHNTYNPFAFDNIPSIPSVRESVVQSQFTFSLTSQTNTMPVDSKLPNYHHHQQSNTHVQPQFTFSLTTQCSTHPIDTHSKSHNPQQQTSSTLNPFSIDYNIIPDIKPKMSTQLPFRLSGSVPPPPLNHKMFPTPNGGGKAHQSNLPKYTASKTSKSSNPRQSINWMTGTSSTEDFQYPIPNRSEMYFPPSVDETFTWSPNKLLDTSMNINSATLPTLHGDLALNTFAMKPISALQKIDKSQKSIDSFLTPLAIPLPTTPPPPTPANFFSVSNLVETRRNTTLDQKSLTTEGRPKITAKESKRSNASKSATPNIFIESFASYPTAIEPKPQISNIYSAEALLSGSNCCPSTSNTNKKDFYSAQAACVESGFPNFDYSCDPSGNNYNFYNSTYLPQNYLENDYLGATSADVKQRPMHFPYTSPTKQQPQQQHCQLSASDTIKELLPPIPIPSQMRPSDSHKKYKHDVFSMQQYDSSLAGSYFGSGLSNPAHSTVEDYYPANNGAPVISSASAILSSHQGAGNISENKQPSSAGSGGSGNLVSNFNLSTICPEINEKIRQNNW